METRSDTRDPAQAATTTIAASGASAQPFDRPAAGEDTDALLDALKQEVISSLAERHRLQAELDATAQALAYTQKELTGLWDLLTTGDVRRFTRTAAVYSLDIVRRAPLTGERHRIQAQITYVRALSRRRRWLWRLVG